MAVKEARMEDEGVDKITPVKKRNVVNSQCQQPKTDLSVLGALQHDGGSTVHIYSIIPQGFSRSEPPRGMTET